MGAGRDHVSTVSLAGQATQPANCRPGRVPIDEARETIRLGSLCRLAAAEMYYVVGADGEEIGTVVAVEAAGRRAVPQHVFLRRRSTHRIERLPFSYVTAVDAVDHVVVVALERRAVDRRRFRVLSGER